MTSDLRRLLPVTAAAFVGLVLTAACASGQTTVEDTGGSKSRRADIAEGGNEAKGFDMAPETTLKVVQAAEDAIPEKMAPGPFKPTWESLKENYRAPKWFAEARFGIFMHWGLYSVPAHHNEWYEKHMYGNAGEVAWHTEHFGPPAEFGYKDFIPKFTAEKFDPDAWAALFKKAGAKYVIPTAQHHDNFSLWDSQANPINAKNMGPKRDLIGELATAVRKQGLKFGVSNHGIEAFQFVNPTPALDAELKAKSADLYDPKWADWYHVADRSDAAAQKFLTNWVSRNVELIDKYQPDIIYFDNGVDQRYLDPVKRWVAAYYYNRAEAWGKQVSISTKKAAYAPDNSNLHTIGSIIDFEKVGARSPAGIRSGIWEVDDPLGSTWGYTTGMKVAPPASIIAKIADTASKNGTYTMNISPMADGTIPEDQQKSLLGIGAWLDVNGEAIYGTHAWAQFSDGKGKDRANVRFTVKGQTLYAIVLGKPSSTLTINALGSDAVHGKIDTLSVLGASSATTFTQTAEELTVQIPPLPDGTFSYVLKIYGLKMNPDPFTQDGNPQP